tara:strand:- start:7970 stop:8137 length:168 start_codon:yes stop_codon:yes gene_type:complete
MLAREFLRRKNPYWQRAMMPPVNGTHRPVTLGIRSTLEVQQEQYQQHGAPDPDDH